ncbi:MAG: hypothetical protein L0Z53_21220, partial [Acidobacteriales bacterium]|nr:hypothetical protein [Terriglobales bacterium]
MTRRSLNLLALWLSVVFTSFLAQAQITYHLHKEASSTTGLFQLKPSGPDGTSIGIQSVNLKNNNAGEYVIKEFDTEAGVPNAWAYLPANSTVTFTLWMKKTANVGTVFPRAKLYLSGPTGSLGAQFCTATGTTALTTTLASYTIACSTTANTSIDNSSRYYLWVGVNLTGTSNTNFNAELGIEGVLNGNFDSRIVVPPLTPRPKIASVSPD